jgi:hypothetical protein
MRWLLMAAVVAAATAPSFAFAGARAAVNVLVTIDKASQRMAVAVDGRPVYLWRISTGRRGYGTPSGVFRPQRMARSYFSRKYYDSPMPYSIFFSGGFAIHGTEYIHRLGGPASHGCVRLHPRNAATLFALVREQGMRATRIVISDAIALQPPEPSRASEPRQSILPLSQEPTSTTSWERREAIEKIERMRKDAAEYLAERNAARATPSNLPIIVVPVRRALGATPLILEVPSARGPR